MFFYGIKICLELTLVRKKKRKKKGYCTKPPSNLFYENCPKSPQYQSYYNTCHLYIWLNRSKLAREPPLIWPIGVAQPAILDWLTTPWPRYALRGVAEPPPPRPKPPPPKFIVGNAYYSMHVWLVLIWYLMILYKLWMKVGYRDLCFF